MEKVREKLEQMKFSRNKAIKEAVECEQDLADKVAKAEALEQQLPTHYWELADLDDKLSETEKRYESLQKRHREAEKKVREGVDAQQALEGRIADGDGYKKKLENELTELTQQNDVFADKIDGLTKQNRMDELNVEKHERRCEELDRTTKNLEVKMTGLSNALKLMQHHEIESSDRKITTVIKL